MASVYKRDGKGNYYASWIDHTGKQRSKSTRSTDKASAMRIAKKYESDAALRREGVIDPTLDAISMESQRSVEEHLVDFENKMMSEGRTLQHIRETKKYILDIVNFGNAGSIASINADMVTGFSVELTNKGKSPRTVQAYLTAIKSFTKWLATNQKLSLDPLTSIKKPNPSSNRKHIRRSLQPDEWKFITNTCTSGEIIYGLEGNERLLLYRIAIETGFRASELKSLKICNFDYNNGTNPAISCPAEYTKNGRFAKQLITSELAKQLHEITNGVVATQSLIKMPHASNLARMLRDDLKRARSSWLAEAKDDASRLLERECSDFLLIENHKGEILDFHSLRHTCGAWHARSGVHPKLVQEIMRHQSITMTMDTYGHLFPGLKEEAIESLAPLLEVDHEDHKLSSKSSDGLQRILQYTGSETTQSGASRCERAGESEETINNLKPLQIRARSEPRRDDTMSCFSNAPLAQLAEQLTLNQ